MTALARRDLFLPEGAKAASTDALKAPDLAVHLLNRASFGVREADFQAAKGVDYIGLVERLLNPKPELDAALEAALATNFKSLNMTGTALYANYPPSENKDVAVMSELRAATLLRQLYSSNQLFEVMVDFWNNHFSVEHSGNQFLRLSKTADDRNMRKFALSKFRDLLFANAKSPAMQFYLDNYVNVKGKPQENYARELMELHTLGVDGGYSEDDVKAVARAFTGWGLNRATIEFVFQARNHDTDAKVVLGKTLPRGRGIEDGMDVLEILATHPSTAKFIATKMVRRFVSDQPSDALVKQVADEYLASDGDIKRMLRVILNSLDFVSSLDTKTKRPNEYIVSALRVTDAAVTGTTYFRAITTVLTNLNHLFSNWPAPNGYPDVASYWINTTAWLTRWNFAFGLVEGSLDRGLVVDVNKLLAGAKTPEAIVNQLASRVLRREMSAQDRLALLNAMSGLAERGVNLAAKDVTLKAKETLSMMLSSRYFHYR